MTKKRKHAIVLIHLIADSMIGKEGKSKVRFRLIVPVSWFLLLLLLLLGACKRQEELSFSIDLPPTSVLAERTRYALITSSHLRLRETPDVSGRVKETLWKGAVMEVIAKASNMVIVENQEGHWYQVSYDGLQGYVFGAYLQLFTSRQAAEDAAASLK